MRLPYSFFPVILFVLIIFTSGIVSAESPGPVSSDTNGSIQDISTILSSEPAGQVVVYFFYNQNCGDCQKALTFMEGFRKRHPDILIRSFDLANNVSNQQLFQQFNKRYNVPFSPVPAVFVGEWELTNVETIELHLDDIVLHVTQNPDFSAPAPSETILPVQLPDIPGTNQLTILLFILAGLMITIGIIVLVCVFYK
jgi:thiol-disulfide isomerase/thioredoxin